MGNGNHVIPDIQGLGALKDRKEPIFCATNPVGMEEYMETSA